MTRSRLKEEWDQGQTRPLDSFTMYSPHQVLKTSNSRPQKEKKTLNRLKSFFKNLSRQTICYLGGKMDLVLRFFPVLSGMDLSTFQEL